MENCKKTAMITGTTSGIGAAIAENLAERGYDLVLVSRDCDKLEWQKKFLQKQYKIKVYIKDIELSDEDAAEKIFLELKKIKVNPVVLINNAGFNECGKFKETNLEKEVQMLAVHICTLTKLTKFFINNLGVDKGYILNVGSTGSYAPFPLDAVYAASKAYVLNFSLAVNTELKNSNISITTLTPGATKTLFAQKAGIDNSLLFSLFVMKPERVAKIAVNALFKRRSKVTPGVYNKLLVLLMKIMPYTVLQFISPLFFASTKNNK